MMRAVSRQPLSPAFSASVFKLMLSLSATSGHGSSGQNAKATGSGVRPASSSEARIAGKGAPCNSTDVAVSCAIRPKSFGQGRDDNDCLGLGKIVCQGQVDAGGVAGRGDATQLLGCPAGQHHGGPAGAQINDAHV